MTPDPGQLVRSFIAGLGKSTDEDVEQYSKFMSKDIVWDTGTDILNGLDEVITHMRGVVTSYGVATWSADIVNQAVDKNVVLNERIDHLKNPQGTVIADLAVMGVFEISDDKIVAWRDIFDPTKLASMLSS